MTNNPPILEVERLTRRFPGVTAVDEVDFALRAGEVHALLGENGAGKSTLIKILGGALRRDAGTMRLNGVPVDFHSPSEALAAGIAVIYQELVLCPHLSVAENVLMGHLPRAAGVTHRLVRGPIAGRRPAGPARCLSPAQCPGRAAEHRPAAARRDCQGALPRLAHPHPR